MSIQTKPEHHRLAAELVKETHENDGLAPVDLDQFLRVVESIEDFWLTIVKLPGDRAQG